MGRRDRRRSGVRGVLRGRVGRRIRISKVLKGEGVRGRRRRGRVGMGWEWTETYRA